MPYLATGSLEPVTNGCFSQAAVDRVDSLRFTAIEVELSASEFGLRQ